jgi:hypothetical protein
MKISRVKEIVQEEVAAFLQKRHLRENLESGTVDQALAGTMPKDGKTNTYGELGHQLVNLGRILRQGTSQIPGLDPREIEELTGLVTKVLEKSSASGIGSKIQQTAKFFDTQTQGTVKK